MKSLIQNWLCIIFLLSISSIGYSQVKISPTPSGSPHASSMLEVESSTRGFLLPRMSSAARIAIVNPATGLLVYDSTDQSFSYFDGNIWQKIVNIFTLTDGRNTLNQAYNQGGAGAGRIITGISGAVEINTTGQNTALKVTNTTMSGIDVSATSGSAIKAQTTDGVGIDITSGKGAAILINKTDIGYGMRALGGINMSKDLVSAKVIGNHTGNYLAVDGRAGFFMIDHATNAKPALQGYTTGPGYGLLGITGMQDSSTQESFPLSGVAGLSFLSSGRRNGITGFSNRARGGLGISNATNSWTLGPDSLNAGIFGWGRPPAEISGGVTNLYAGTVGFVNSGLGVLGVNRGYGHGVIGVTKGSSGAGTQAGVWGMIQDSSSWSGHASNFPFVDGGYNKGLVAVLGQAGDNVAMWAESRNKVGLVASLGEKSELAFLPPEKAAIMAISRKSATGSAAIFLVDTTSKPAVNLESFSTDVAFRINQKHSGQAMRILQMGTGQGVDLVMANDASSLSGLFIQSLNKGIGAKISLDNPMNMSTALVASTLGKGPVASFTSLDTANIENSLIVKNTGLGSAGLFSIEKSTSTPPNMAPALVAKTNGQGRAAFFEVSGGKSSDPAVEIKTSSGRSTYFSSENDTATTNANTMTYTGKGHGLEIVSTHSTSTTPDAVLHVEGEHGFIAHFDDKTPILGGRTDPVVLITSSAGLGTVGLKISIPAACLGCKAAEFDGMVEFTKTLKVVGELEASKIKGEVETDNNFTVGDSFFVKGPANLDGKLNVAGVTTINGATTVNANTTVNGTLHATTATATVKMFKIDHPLNPEKKYLNHVSTESNEALVQYSGNIISGKDGYAKVEMPEYVNALANDFRYHLTILGKDFAQVIVAEEINDQGVFIIRTDKPDIKVSWQVTGVRQDKFMVENPLVVEQWKPGKM